MDSLGSIAVFVQVAETRSFTEAGRLQGVSSSAVGKSIARLEARLGVRLFQRTTRSVTLTSEGAMFLERCRKILAEHVHQRDGEDDDYRRRCEPGRTDQRRPKRFGRREIAGDRLA